MKKNLIVKAIGETEYEYVKGKGWVESGIMMRYFDYESPYYDLYEEITEEEAKMIINK